MNTECGKRDVHCTVGGREGWRRGRAGGEERGGGEEGVEERKGWRRGKGWRGGRGGGEEGVEERKGVEGRGIRIYDGYPGRNRMQFIAATKK